MRAAQLWAQKNYCKRAYNVEQQHLDSIAIVCFVGEALSIAMVEVRAQTKAHNSLWSGQWVEISWYEATESASCHRPSNDAVFLHMKTILRRKRCR